MISDQEPASFVLRTSQLKASWICEQTPAFLTSRKVSSCHSERSEESLFSWRCPYADLRVGSLIFLGIRLHQARGLS